MCLKIDMNGTDKVVRNFVLTPATIEFMDKTADLLNLIPHYVNEERHTSLSVLAVQAAGIARPL